MSRAAYTVVMKRLRILGAGVLVTFFSVADARAFWEEPGAPASRADHVMRARPLDLAAPDRGPLAELLEQFKRQEARRLRALRDEYPTTDSWTGRYDPAAMRAWQRRVERQQSAAAASAAGDAALALCERAEACAHPVARALFSMVGAALHGVHWRVPKAPVEARVDTPPGLRLELRRVRVGVECRVAF